MHPAGGKAFAARTDGKTGIYAYEQRRPRPRAEKFPAALEKIFRANPPAWRFWRTTPPGYRRTVIHWVTGAKQEPTRQARLARLIADSAAGRRAGERAAPSAPHRR